MSNSIFKHRFLKEVIAVNDLIYRAMIIFFTFFLISYAAMAQLDSQGWTTLDPERTSKIIYVSSSGGNDATGMVYSPTDNAIGSDPQKPAETVKAFKTLEAASAEISSGEAAWVLLKTGDTFYENFKPLSGKSATEPMVLSYYGSGTTAPLLKVGSQFGLVKVFDVSNFQAIGIHFYAHTRNPKDSDYVNAEGGLGFYFFANAGKSVENILIEGCVFRFFKSNEVHGYGIVKNIKLRRNLILDNYREDGAHSQGLWSKNSDHLLLEENIFDHNGWYRQAYGTDGKAKTEGQANMYNHNTYFSDVKNTTFIGNSFLRPSSMGNKFTAQSGAASTSNVTLSNNLYYDCEVGIGIGGNDYDRTYRFKNVEISGNVLSSGGMSRPTNRTFAHYMEIVDWDKGNVRENLLLNQENEEVKLGSGMSLYGKGARDVTVENNLLYNLRFVGNSGNSPASGIGIGANYSNSVIRNNQITLNVPENSYLDMVSNGGGKTSVFKDNTYNSIGDGDLRFRVNGNRLDYNSWASQYETGSSIEPLEYPDSERDLDTYVTRVLNLSGMDAFYSEIRKMSKLNWNPAYSAPVINNWIKEGFGISGSPTPSPDLYTFTVTNGTGGGAYEAGTVVNIAANDPPEGKVFDSWTGNVSGIDNVKSNNTTFTMPAAAASVSATYKDETPAVEGAAQIRQTTADITIDGNVDDAWASANEYSINNIIPGGGLINNAPDLSGSFKMFWSTSDLFILIDVNDQKSVQLPEGGNVWNFDGLEIFFDGDYSRGSSFDGVNDFQFSYAQGVEKLFRNGSVFTDFQSAEVLTSDGYRAEIKIPWTSLGTTPQAGKLIGLEVALNDNDKPGTDVREGYRAWNATEKFPIAHTHKYGTGQLTGSGQTANNSTGTAVIDKAALQAEKVLFFPNPSSGRITILKKGTITITNGVGEIIRSSESTGDIQIDLTGEPKGMYLIKVENKDGVSTQRLLID